MMAAFPKNPAENELVSFGKGKVGYFYILREARSVTRSLFNALEILGVSELAVVIECFCRGDAGMTQL